MAPITRRRFLAASSAVGLALLSAPSASAAALSPPKRAPAPTAAPTRARSLATQEVVIGIGVDPVTLDPRQTQVSEAFALTHVLNEESLFRDGDGTIIPYLARSWEYTSDTTLTLRLKPGLAFENGEPVDSAAVKFTIESILDPANTWIAPEKRGWFDSLDHIEAPDSGTVVFVTKEPNHALLSYLTLAGIVPPVAAKAAGAAYGNAPSGTGPFKLVRYTPGDSLVYEARPNYWGGAPKAERMRIRFLKEDATRVAALEAGEVQAINNVPPDSLARIKANDQIEVVAVPSVRVVFLTFMTDRSPFDNIVLRHAMNYAVDRQSIVDNILGGYGRVAESMFAPGVRFFKPQKPYEYDPDKARALIAQSGFQTSRTLKFAYPSGRTINDKAAAEAVAAMLEDVGLRLELDNPEWGTFLDNYQKRRIYDFVMASMAPANLDPDYALFPWFRSDTSFIKYSNPKADELLRAGARALDPAKQEEIYSQVQTFLWEDAPWAPLYVVPQLWARSKQLAGFQLRPDGIFVFKDARVE